MKYNKNTGYILKKGDIKFPLNQTNCNSKGNKIKPLIIYNNSLLNKVNALADNIGKSVIYRWVHKINNKSYVGSSNNLNRRLKEYYSINNIKIRVLTGNSRIYRVLLKDGYESFNLEILEYCDKNIRVREQYYIDIIKPEYNMRKACRSSINSFKTQGRF